MEEQSQEGYEQDKGVHTNVDMKYYYTDLAWHILTSKHNDQYKYEFFHDETVSAITAILTFNDDDEFIEMKLQKILGGEGPGNRIAQYYLCADESLLPIKLYKKRKKRNVPEIKLFNRKKEISFNRVGAELVRNFIRQGYEQVFPHQQQVVDFIEDNKELSHLQLEERIEEYMTTTEEDEDDGFLELVQMKKEYADVWPAFLTAVVLLWKSKSAEDLHRAMEVLEDVEVALKDEFEGWKEEYMSPEFHDGADAQFDDLLWQIVCSAAYQCKDDIYTTIDAAVNDLDEEELCGDTEDVVLVEFFSDIMKYMNTPSQEIRDDVFYMLREQYRDICQRIEDDILGDFDDETGEYREDE